MTDGSRCPVTGGQHDFRPDPVDPQTPRIRTCKCQHCDDTVLVTNPPS